MNPKSAHIFPIPPLDAHGRALVVGSKVRVASVTSCLTGLPLCDQTRLKAIVGQTRQVVRFDGSGFLWLSFTADKLSDDFCLFPNEVDLEH